MSEELLHERRSRVEREAATQLGLLIFAFSALDMDLALHLVWMDEGKDLERLTAQLNESAIHRKLELMARRVEAAYSTQREPLALYKAWLQEAHAMRELRNELIHGRWGPSGLETGLTNVIGIPTSPAQRAVSYTPEQLAQFVGRIHKLRTDHSKIRKRWPL